MKMGFFQWWFFFVFIHHVHCVDPPPDAGSAHSMIKNKVNPHIQDMDLAELIEKNGLKPRLERKAAMENLLKGMGGGVGSIEQRTGKLIHFEDRNAAVLQWIDTHRDELAVYEQWKADQNSWTRRFKFGTRHMSLEGFGASFSVIVVSELGDKTFFIAAVMAMRHSRITVYAGAMGALVLMTVLGVVFGHLLSVIPQWITQYLAGTGFIIFGLKLLYDSRSMTKGGTLEELREAEEDVEKAEKEALAAKRSDSLKRRANMDSVESGHVARMETGQSSSSAAMNNDEMDADEELGKYSKTKKIHGNHLKRTGRFDMSVFIRSFVMTFINEVGDRSQIATVVLASHKNPWGVTFGSLGGHGLCTAIAVLGGKFLATKISEKNIAIIGGILFLLFGLESFIYGPIE